MVEAVPGAGRGVLVVVRSVSSWRSNSVACTALHVDVRTVPVVGRDLSYLKEQF